MRKTYQIEKDNYEDAGQASRDIKMTLKTLGLDPKVLKRVSIACYEAEIDVYKRQTLFCHNIDDFTELKLKLENLNYKVTTFSDYDQIISYIEMLNTCLLYTS